MLPSVTLPRIENPAGLTALTYDAIRAAIVGRKLPAGSKLSVPELASRLRVSRTPVKEALTRLEREGLVTTVPNRGSFVSFLSADDVREVYQLREMLEGLVCRLAAEKVQAGHVRALRRLLRTQEQALRSANIDRIIQVDLEFHRYLRELAGNRRLKALLQNLQDQIRIVFATSITIPGRRQKAVAEHLKILAAIERRDPEAAERAAREHIAEVRAAVLAELTAGPAGAEAGRCAIETGRGVPGLVAPRPVAAQSEGR